MTICNSMKNAVEKRLKAGRKIDEIGKELCAGVKHPERKIIRIIKEIDGKGERYLIDNADELGFTGVTQLKNAIKRREEKKDQSTTKPKNEVQEIGLEKTEEEKPLNEQLIELIKKYQNAHPQDWENLIMKCIKDFESENSSTAFESEITETPTEGDEYKMPTSFL